MLNTYRTILKTLRIIEAHVKLPSKIKFSFNIHSKSCTVLAVKRVLKRNSIKFTYRSAYNIIRKKKHGHDLHNLAKKLVNLQRFQ